MADGWERVEGRVTEELDGYPCQEAMGAPRKGVCAERRQSDLWSSQSNLAECARKPEEWTKDQLLLPRSQFVTDCWPLFINSLVSQSTNTVDHLLYAQL